MAFGKRNAPSTFQRLMNIVLSGLTCCDTYFDDLVVCSSSWEEHVEHLSQVFTHLREAGLTINLATIKPCSSLVSSRWLAEFFFSFGLVLKGLGVWLWCVLFWTL